MNGFNFTRKSSQFTRKSPQNVQNTGFVQALHSKKGVNFAVFLPFSQSVLSRFVQVCPIGAKTAVLGPWGPKSHPRVPGRSFPAFDVRGRHCPQLGINIRLGEQIPITCLSWLYHGCVKSIMGYQISIWGISPDMVCASIWHRLS